MISDGHETPLRKSYNRKKLYKLSSNSPLARPTKFEKHYHNHSHGNLLNLFGVVLASSKKPQSQYMKIQKKIAKLGAKDFADRHAR